MAHHTKDKGDLGVAKVIADLADYDIYCCAPLSEHMPFDLIAVSPDQTKTSRIQVKYRAAINGTVRIPLRTTWADKNGSHINITDRSTFEAYALYCPQTKQVYYVNNREIPHLMTNNFSLRLTHPANNQQIGIRMAEEYTCALRLFE